MCPTKERTWKMSGADEMSYEMEDLFLGTLSPDPWDFSH